MNLKHNWRNECEKFDLCMTKDENSKSSKLNQNFEEVISLALILFNRLPGG